MIDVIARANASCPALSGTITSPECNVDSTDAHTIYLYKFAATHGAFFSVVGILLLVGCLSSDKRAKRQVMNTVKAVR